MKIAVHNPFFNQPVAEAELVKRISQAAGKNGHEVIEFGSSSAICEYEPDFVLAMHHKVAKLTRFPTYGCMWNPKSFIDNSLESNIFLKNILSYDAYLYSSTEIKDWLSDYLYTTHKKCFFQNFYASCYKTEYHRPNLDNIKLFYCGTNWDGYRFDQLFLELEKTQLLEVYGPEKSWDYLKNAYCGTLPFNGYSVLERIRSLGVGLCLHRQEHFDSNTPSMRVFEIIAAGALAICDDLPFIKDVFGDAVFYIDHRLDPATKKQEILKILDWIKNNQVAAQVKSKTAHEIFCRCFSLETLLEEVISQHQKLLVQKYLKVDTRIEESLDLKVSKENGVEIIMRVGGRPIAMIERALNSVQNQTYKNVSVLLVEFKHIEGLDDLIERYHNSLNIRKIHDSQNIPNRSSTLWSGLNNLSHDFFGILDDDDILHPNHIAILISILESNKRVGVAYSGSIKIVEIDEGNTSNKLLEENSSLDFFENFSIDRLWNSGNFITSNSFIARTDLLDSIILKCPDLVVFEDYFLLLYLSSKTLFNFSFEATCSFYHRASLADNSVYIDRAIWGKNMERLKNILGNLNYPLIANLNETSMNNWEAKYQLICSELEIIKKSYAQISSEINNLKSYKSEVSAMKSSKFWKLREMWFRVKSLIR